MRRTFPALLIAVALAGLQVGPAGAAPPTPALPPAQEAVLIQVQADPVVADADEALARAGGRCWSQHASVTGRTLVGVHLFTWHMSTVWCARGGVIAAVAPRPALVVNNWPHIPWNSIWTYQGLAFMVRGGGPGQAHVYRRAGGTFRACVLWVCTTKIPWLAFTMRANGTSHVDGGW